MGTTKRKKEHIKLCLEENVQFRNKCTGLEKYDFIHLALPELNFEDVNTSCQFLGKELSFPFMITAITGGCDDAYSINKVLSEVCAEHEIALGVGSQRPLLEGMSMCNDFKITREMAPDGIIIGNIGAAQIIDDSSSDTIQTLIDSITADAIAIHLNPLQELLQPEGDRNFQGVLKALDRLSKSIAVPLIVKEVGCGISAAVVSQLVDCGIKYIDVAGSGGTSWASIEGMRGDSELAEDFRDWGIPTAKCLVEGVKVSGAKIIASGGLRSGLDLAKSLALGAEIGGAAHPILMALHEGGKQAVSDLITRWKSGLKMAMFLTGSDSVENFKKSNSIFKI